MEHATMMRKLALGAAAGSLVLGSIPARADDSSTSTGLLTYLGLKAASGGATLGSGGGELEAWLLAMGPIDKVGQEIARIAADSAARLNGHPILVLVQDQQVNLSAPGLLHQRLQAFLERVDATDKSCPRTLQGPGFLAPPPPEGQPSVTAADIVGAIQTATTYTGFDMTPTDAALANSVAIKLKERIAKVILPGERTLPTSSVLATQFSEIKQGIKALSQCAEHSNEQAALLADWATLNGDLNKRDDKTGTTPLEDATALYDIVEEKPLVLRLHLEKAGGSAVTRSNIWYSLGISGAVTLSAGVFVSYRLVDPATGVPLAAGMAGCVTERMDINAVAAKASAAKCTLVSKS